MNRKDFLEKLKQALNGRVSPDVVTDNLRYYEDYINTEIRKGRTEEEVLKQLGDPRLIARTIIQTHGNGRNGKGRAADVNGDARTYSSGGETDGQEDDDGERRYGFRLPGWALGIILLSVAVLVVMGVLSFVFSVVSILFPVILIIAAVAFVVKLFRDWIH